MEGLLLTRRVFGNYYKFLVSCILELLASYLHML